MCRRVNRDRFGLVSLPCLRKLRIRTFPHLFVCVLGADWLERELYHLLVSALGVAAKEDSKALVLKTIRVAVELSQVFDFQKLASAPAVEQLAKDKDPAYDFLQILLTGTLESYRAFIASHPTFLADNRIAPHYSSPFILFCRC